MKVATASLVFSPTASMTNDSFATALCAAAAQSDPIASNSILSVGNKIFVLPDCFWTYTSQSSYFAFTNIIMTGSATGTVEAGPTSLDPLMRMPSTTTFISFTRVYFANPSNASYVPDMNAFASLYSSIQTFTCIQCGLNTNLFDSAPPSLFTLNLASSGLTGTIPPTFLSKINGNGGIMDHKLSGNKLSGPVPSNLLSNFANGNAYTSISFDVSDNMLTGTLPSLFKNAAFSANTFKLYLGGNQLTGSLPADFFPSARAFPYTTLNISYNALSGEIPEDFGATLFKKFPYATYLYASHNAFTGTLPGFFRNITRTKSSSYSVIIMDFSYNQFSALEPTFFPNGTLTVNGPLSFDISHNLIEGAISDLTICTTGTSILLDLSYNKFTSGADSFTPSSLLDSSSPSTTIGAFTLNLNNNQLGGVLNLTAFPSIYSRIWTVGTTGGVLMNASSNAFDSLVMDDTWAIAFTVLDLSHNPHMSGRIFPDAMFGSSSFLRTLYASDTALSGEFPDLATISPKYLARIDMSDNTGIEFCNVSRNAWSANLGLCLFLHTNAVSCPAQYPFQCRFSAPLPIPPPITPVAIPVETPVEVPVAIPVETPAPIAIPVETPVEVPVSVPSVSPYAPDVPVAAPVAPVEAPVALPVEAPLDVPALLEAPVATPLDATAPTDAPIPFSEDMPSGAGHCATISVLLTVLATAFAWAL